MVSDERAKDLVDARTRTHLMSALSARKDSRNSERDVNMRYGSGAPMVMRSSTSTPMKLSLRCKTKGAAPRAFKPALMPARIPCAAASS